MAPSEGWKRSRQATMPTVCPRRTQKNTKNDIRFEREQRLDPRSPSTSSPVTVTSTTTVRHPDAGERHPVVEDGEQAEAQGRGGGTVAGCRMGCHRATRRSERQCAPARLGVADLPQNSSPRPSRRGHRTPPACCPRCGRPLVQAARREARPTVRPGRTSPCSPRSRRARRRSSTISRVGSASISACGESHAGTPRVAAVRSNRRRTRAW